MATPTARRRALPLSQAAVPELPIALHFHNTRGIGLVNVMAGLAEGIDIYESSFAGLGGCPFAAGATGNICTEDLVYLLHEIGIETGIDLERLCGAARHVEQVIGRTLPGQVMKAGPRLQLHPMDEVADRGRLSALPLSGIRVVDLTRILAGPFCTQLLADLGADVVKIEAPGQGDPVRGQGAIKDGLSWYFAQFNRNKRSITLDLYQDEGKRGAGRPAPPAPTCWSRTTAPACSTGWASPRRASRSSTRASWWPASTATAAPGPTSIGRRSTSSPRR